MSRCCWKPPECIGHHRRSDNVIDSPKISSQSFSKTSSQIQVKDVGVEELEHSKTIAGYMVENSTDSDALGNPRNKCALQPGHSLMDWIRLGSSGADLTGVGDRSGTLRISRDELAKHNTPNDAWIAIQGCVYNVTRYLPFHPGGEDELIRGIGQDATTLFNKVHAWVNYGQILHKCLIGRLVSNNTTSESELKLLFERPKSEKPINNAPMGGNTKQLGALETLNIDKPNLRDANKAITRSSNILDRGNSVPQTSLKFDWIQTSGMLTLIFYTKAYSNCPISVSKVCLERPSAMSEQVRLDSILPSVVPPPRFSMSSNASQSDGDNLAIKILLDNQIVYLIELRLQRAIKWPPVSIYQNFETGKCEIVVEKAIIPLMWTSFGTISQSTVNVTDEWYQINHSYELVGKFEVTQNTHLYLMQRNQEASSFIPVGYHVKIFLEIDGILKSRPYTPVLPALYTSAVPVLYNTDCLCFLIKNYPNGELTKVIHKLKIGDNVKISRALSSGFQLNLIEDKTRFLMVAAGTGIAPFVGLLKFVLERRHRKCKRVKLLFFNKTENDIIWKDQFDKLETLDERFTVTYVLSSVSNSNEWTGKVGHIDENILKEVLEDLLLVENISETEGALHTSFVSVCGPNEFTIKANSLLSSVKLTSVNYKLRPDQIYCFMG